MPFPIVHEENVVSMSYSPQTTDEATANLADFNAEESPCTTRPLALPAKICPIVLTAKYIP